MQSVLKHIFNRIYQIIYILKRVSLIYCKLKCSATLLYICGSAPSNQIYRRRLFFECSSLRASSSFLKLSSYLWLFCKKICKQIQRLLLLLCYPTEMKLLSISEPCSTHWNVSFLKITFASRYLQVCARKYILAGQHIDIFLAHRLIEVISILY